MSSYVNFYIRNGKTNSITYLFGFSKSNYIYEAFYDALGTNRNKEGYCDVLGSDDIVNIRGRLHDQEKKYNALIDQYQNTINEIGNWNNSVEEKIEEIFKLKSDIQSIREELEQIEHAIGLYTLLDEMQNYNPDNAIILAGIDCYASREEEEASA